MHNFVLRNVRIKNAEYILNNADIKQAQSL